MPTKKEFYRLVETGKSVGEIVTIDEFIIQVRGLNGVYSGAVVLMENGSEGIVHRIKNDNVDILSFEKSDLEIGMKVVVKEDSLFVKVGISMRGRVVSPLGKALDKNGLIARDDKAKVFNEAIKFSERDLLGDQLETGVILVDTLFPIVYGQRIAVMGDNNSGKTTFAIQLAINQAHKGKIVVYVLIGKRSADIEKIKHSLHKSGVMKNIIIVLADVFESLPITYIAPYSGCAIAEYFWKNGHDTIIIYDDLDAHAKAYREMSLLLKSNPGREGYPGDMFYMHSSLLERAGKLKSNKKTLTSIPISVTPNDDITSYLSTSLISITDGQIIFDNKIMRGGNRPAVNVGISVSRVGGRGQSDFGRKLASDISVKLAQYRSALVTSRFITGQSDEAKSVLRTGQRIEDAFKQDSNSLFNIYQQQILLNTVILSEKKEKLDISLLKEKIMKIPSHKVSLNDLEIISKELDTSGDFNK